MVWCQPSPESKNMETSVACCCVPISLCCVLPWAVMIWVLAFVRHSRDVTGEGFVMPRHEWVAPMEPFWGCIITWTIAWVFTYIYIWADYTADKWDPEGLAVRASFFFSCMVSLICTFYALGGI